MVNYLNSTGRPAIVIAGNGMCSGGRIVNYLKAMLGDAQHEVVFVGYQAQGTPGAVIQASERVEGGQVGLGGQMYDINLKVVSLYGYSAHADQDGLTVFVTAMVDAPAQVLLVHGDKQAKKMLQKVLEQTFASKGEIPRVLIPV